MDLLGGMTLGIALVGAVLGILNTWRNFDRDRPKLRVTPMHAIPVGGYERAYSGIGFGIEVINLSPFPITVREVGFMHRGLSDRAVVVEPVTVDNKGTPRRLEPREAVAFYMETPSPREGRPLRCAYASTACGLTFTGTSGALKQMNG